MGHTGKFPLGARAALAAAAAPVVLLGAVFVGSSGLCPRDVLAVFLHKLFGVSLPEGVSDATVAIVWALRLPRVLLAFFAGAALAVSGCAVQSALKNPLATPYTLGVSSGASLGAGLAIVFGLSAPLLGSYTLPSLGFGAALLTVLLVLGFSARVDKNLSNMTVILTGMVFSLFFSAVLTVITALADDSSVRQITLWQMGSFSMRGWSYVGLLLPFFAVGFLGLLFCSRELDLLTFGDETAASLGVDARRAKRIVFLCAALLTGAAVAVCGVIGFVDLIAPQVVRRLFGSRHRLLLPMCAVVGGCFMVAADLAARTIISPSELPVGAVTAILGAPFFAWVYFRGRK